MQSIILEILDMILELKLGGNGMLWWLLGITVTAALILWAARFCYRLVFFNRNDKESDPLAVPPGDQYAELADEMLQVIGELMQVPYESVFITSRDGLKLFGRYYHFRDGAPVQLQFHGYRGNGIREYAGGHAMAMKMGYNTIVVDERAHGKSQGHTITFGIKERYDVLDWIDYTLKRFGKDTKIILSGVSMGAATVLMASDLDIPKNVVAITADCPYSAPGEIIRKVSRDVRIPGWLAYPFIALGGWLYGGFAIWSASAVKSVKNAKAPIHLIHGDDDRFVPCEMSRKILNACTGKARLVVIKDAGHGLSFLKDREKYEKAFMGFLKECGI